MKKILSILSTISLFTIISTNIIACNTKNKNNKPNTNNEPIKQKFKPQEPPQNNNWKLVDDFWKEVEQSSDDKWYIGIYYRYGKTDKDKYWVINKFNNITKIKINYYDEVYRWDGIGEPIAPNINKNTGEITN